jgi:hypothetical protein
VSTIGQFSLAFFWEISWDEKDFRKRVNGKVASQFL